MFYEQSEITELLNCEHCLQPYDEYYQPKILHCCGKTICNTCIRQIENQVQNNNYKCIACNDIDTIPKNGFQVNLAVAKLISKQPKEISRGPEAEKLKLNLRELDDLVNKFLFEMENGEFLIAKECEELKRQIQLAKEERIQKINQLFDSLLLRIDDYAEKCNSKYKEMNEAKHKSKELIKLVNESIKQQNSYLRQLKINEVETLRLNEKMSELKTLIGKERIFIKKSIFGNEIMKFEANLIPIDEQFLGKIIHRKSDFTVIILIYFSFSLLNFIIIMT